jgi:hypothetical protein
MPVTPRVFVMAICFGIPQKLEARRAPVAYKMHYSIIIINVICNILLLIVIAELQIITFLL